MKFPGNVALIVFTCAGSLLAQQPTQPQVKVNFLNVCAPPETEKAEILAALNRLPPAPQFGTDFEVARGRTTATTDVSGDPATKSAPESSRWVRIRKEFVESSPYLNAQYTFSLTGNTAEESLVLRIREPKDVMQVSISNEAEALADPVQMLSVRTPADRIRLERFGKSSLVLARCKGADQAAYESLFEKASEVLNLYRSQLGARPVVAQDLPKTAERSSPPSRPKGERKP